MDTELELKYLEDIDYQYDRLVFICKTTLGADITLRTRERLVSEAKMICSLLLRSSGHTLKQIGVKMGYDHSTIIYHLGAIESYINMDKNVRKKFEVVSTAFYTPIQDMEEAENKQLKNTILLLQEEIKLLSLWKEKNKATVTIGRKYEELLTEIETNVPNNEKDFFVKKMIQTARRFSL
jgi:DNA-binding CsgD family transcriptional regulator